MKKGFVTLITVLALLVFSVSISIAMTYISISESRVSADVILGEQAFVLSESCAELALLKLRNDTSYTGGSMHVSEGDCEVTVNTTGDESTVSVRAIRGEYTRSVRVEVTRDILALQMRSWQEGV
jgi:type II secretory pathway component PulK